LERIIVRRGRFLTYELLRRTFGGDPNVEIVWDRRRAAAPPAENPDQDRRGRPPEQWYRLDYLFTTGAQVFHRPSNQQRASCDEPPSES
jgi:hypothetical protein